MKIVSWNINSLNVRQEHVKSYLKTAAPDVLMVQELKCAELFDIGLKPLGYNVYGVCQKSYNGVAVFTKKHADIVLENLPGDNSDTQARYLEFDYDGLRLINIYLPNGNPAPGDKYDYKLAWMERLYNHLKTLQKQSIPFAIGGDFNIIPEPKDCYDSKAWKNDALFMLPSRQAFRKLINLGLTDAFRVYNNQAGQYTFWDYQAGAWPKNLGIRIDHFLLSPYIADRLKSCVINTEPRGWDRPSDHTPIELEITWP